MRTLEDIQNATIQASEKCIKYIGTRVLTITRTCIQVAAMSLDWKSFTTRFPRQQRLLYANCTWGLIASNRRLLKSDELLDRIYRNKVDQNAMLSSTAEQPVASRTLRKLQHELGFYAI